jgi:hypothetical protein
MEEAAVLEEKKYIFSFIFHKIAEEWKKLGKDIQKTWQKLWKCWKNGRSCGSRK